MKQVYLAAVPGAGYPVRAATAGLTPEALETVQMLAPCALPAHLSPTQAHERAPKRLALLRTLATARTLVHSAWTGPGEQYFTHALLGVPDNLDTESLVQSWGSPLWQQTDDPTIGAELPAMPYPPVADSFNDTVLREFFDQTIHRELLSFVLSALMTTPPGVRIFIAAPADDVARCIYAITRALPLALSEALTFSTYEPHPLACSARIVGTTFAAPAPVEPPAPPPPAEPVAEGAEPPAPVEPPPPAAPPPMADLPEECYAGMGVGFNVYSGRRTKLPEDLPFAEFAVDALASGKTERLDEFRATWQRLGVKEPMYLGIVYRLARGTGVLTKEESLEALQNPAIAAWISPRPDVLRQFVEWALEDREFANNGFSRVAVALRQKPEIVAKLTQTVHDEGVTALKDGDVPRTANALEMILPMIAPARANAIWGELLKLLTTPNKLSWDMRWYLLPKFVRIKPPLSPTTIDDALKPWVTVPPDRLAQLLALELPRAYHLVASLACLHGKDEPSETTARALATHPQLTMNVLQQLATAPKLTRVLKLPDTAAVRVEPPPPEPTSEPEASTLPPEADATAAVPVDVNAGLDVDTLPADNEPPSAPATPVELPPSAPVEQTVQVEADRAVFEAVLSVAPGYPWVDELIRAGTALPTPTLDRCLDVALQQGRLDPVSTVRFFGPALLALLPQQPSFDRICHDFFQKPPTDVLLAPNLIDFARQLKDRAGLRDGVQVRRDAYLTMVDYLANPSLVSERLTGAAHALAQEPPLFPPGTLEQVIGKVSSELTRKADEPTIQTDLEESLLRLGQRVTGGETALFRTLLKTQSEHKQFWKHTELLHAFFAVALGATQAPELPTRLENLEGDAFNLAFTVAQRGGRKPLEAITAKAANWPRSAATTWNYLAKAVMPRGAAGVARDSGLVVGGLVIGLIVAKVLSALGWW
jgi:hypothetical protein